MHAAYPFLPRLQKTSTRTLCGKQPSLRALYSRRTVEPISLQKDDGLNRGVTTRKIGPSLQNAFTYFGRNSARLTGRGYGSTGPSSPPPALSLPFPS